LRRKTFYCEFLPAHKPAQFPPLCAFCVRFTVNLFFRIFQKGLKEHAEIYIALNWFFPFVVLFISSATYDCSKAYVCPFEYVPEDKLVENAGPGKSSRISSHPCCTYWLLLLYGARHTVRILRIQWDFIYS